ncbi:MAG: hypothetical protein OHK0046_25710 [Anaerolineae bacterium]
MTYPAYSPEEALMRETFLALMWAFSHPGRIYDLPQGDPYHAIGETLLDLETSYFTLDDALAHALARTGARSLPVERAAYHFYPMLTDDLLETVKHATIGSLLYPDEGATLILGCEFHSGPALHLSGPGIPPESTHTIQIGGLPAAFWELRESAIRYPRGWDIYLVAGQQVIGLPRTTKITRG